MINPYLQQTQMWSQFFLRAHAKDSRHQIHKFSSHSFEALVYQYPLFGSKVFWYIPRAFAVKSSINESNSGYIEEIKSLLHEIERKAHDHGNVVLLKVDWNPLEIFNGVGAFLAKNGYTHSDRKIQYTKTKILQLPEGLQLQTKDNVSDVDLQTIIQFWDENQKTLSQLFDKRTRYGIRKALQHPWKIAISKSQNEIESFLSLHMETAKRQRFTPFSHHYFNQLFSIENSLIINLYDENDVPHASWFGVHTNGTMYHLFGANDLYSRDHYGQYLLHLITLFYMSNNSIVLYDLGGLEDGKGFDLFKKGFKGEVIDFLGPYDKTIKPMWHICFKLYRAIKKHI